jgi:PEGA domain
MNRILSKLLLATLLSASTRALADVPKPGARPGTPSAAKSAPDHADELFEQGAAAYDAGRLPEAQAKLEQAWALKKTHDIAGNLGVVELKLARYPQAAEHLTWALQHFPPTEADQAKRGFEQQLAKARAQIGALRVKVNIDGAEVAVNGRAIGMAPVDDEVFVEVGTVSVSARREGYVTAVQSITVAKGEAREVSVTLAPVVVAPERRSVTPAVVLGSVGGVALISGAVLLGVAEGKRSEMASLTVTTQHSCVAGNPSPQGACATLASVASNADRLGDLGVGGMVLAGVAAAGVVTYLLWPAPRREAGAVPMVRVLPVVGAGGGGVLFAGSF